MNMNIFRLSSLIHKNTPVAAEASASPMSKLESFKNSLSRISSNLSDLRSPSHSNRLGFSHSIELSSSLQSPRLAAFY